MPPSQGRLIGELERSLGPTISVSADTLDGEPLIWIEVPVAHSYGGLVRLMFRRDECEKLCELLRRAAQEKVNANE